MEIEEIKKAFAPKTETIEVRGIKFKIQETKFFETLLNEVDSKDKHEINKRIIVASVVEPKLDYETVSEFTLDIANKFLTAINRLNGSVPVGDKDFLSEKKTHG